MTDAIVPTNGNTRLPMAPALRRLVLLDRARTALGGGARLAEVLGIGRRAVTHKLAAERGLSNAELVAIADALDRRADQLVLLADSIRAVTL